MPASPSAVAAADAGDVATLGAVTGRVFEEPKRLDGPDTPLEGTTIVLLPRSEEFLAALEAVKRDFRKSDAAYLRAIHDVRVARDAYARRLEKSRGPARLRSATAGADGTFAIDDVPPGEWVLLAERAVFAKMREAPDVAPAPGRRNRFARRPPSGVHTVTVWLRPLTVAAGRSKHVDLTDRGAWLTGVVEQRGGEALPGSAQMPDR